MSLPIADLGFEAEQAKKMTYDGIEKTRDLNKQLVIQKLSEETMAKLNKDLEAEKAYIQELKSTFKQNEERQIQS